MNRNFYIVAAPPFQMWSREGGESIYIRASYYSLLADASLGLGQPEVKPSTPRPLPLRVSRVDEMGTGPRCMHQ